MKIISLKLLLFIIIILKKCILIVVRPTYVDPPMYLCLEILGLVAE